MDGGSNAAKRESSVSDSDRNSGANAEVCLGRKNRANRTWVRPGVPRGSLRETAFTHGSVVASVALLRVVCWYFLLGGVAHPIAVQCFLADTGGFSVYLHKHTQAHTHARIAMLELVMDVWKSVPFLWSKKVQCETQWRVDSGAKGSREVDAWRFDPVFFFIVVVSALTNSMLAAYSKLLSCQSSTGEGFVRFFL